MVKKHRMSALNTSGCIKRSRNGNGHIQNPLFPAVSVKHQYVYSVCLISLLFLLLVIGAPEVMFFFWRASTKSINNTNYSTANANTTPRKTTENSQSFTPIYQYSFLPKKVFLEGRRISPLELWPGANLSTSDSNVRVFLFDDFLSHFECDSLRAVHDKHIKEWSEEQPLLCFESLRTLKQNLINSGVQATKIRHLSNSAFTEGTRCLNASYSKQVADILHHNWSYSTAFYPGESEFSKKMTALIQETTGLKKENGGKFQITSYPQHIGYKQHTDCVENSSDKRDRMATVLVYLDDVEQGGETSFTKLGISVRPRKGRALVWNNMTPDGECDRSSIHEANQVIKGHKYILQRWYYLESFETLGKRPDAPPLPHRRSGQAMVSCDEYKHGSCRWYDEWSYDVMEEYRFQQLPSRVDRFKIDSHLSM